MRGHLLLRQLGLAVALAFGGVGAVGAQALVSDYVRALRHDPSYAAARASSESSRLQARLASMAYFPEGRISSTQLDNEKSGRFTVSVSQPLISYDRWLALKEADPRLAGAAARLEQSQYELAQRVYGAVSGLTEAREKLRLNDAATRAISAQVQSARRAFELGQGTITDVHDAELRLAQNRSEAFSLKAGLAAAERQYDAVMGERPAPASYALTQQPVALNLPPLDDFLARARTRNPGIRASQQATILAELAVKRARASLFPTLAAVAQQSRIRGGDATSSATISLRMEVPLQAGTYFRSDAAVLELQQAQAKEREVLQKVNLDVERLYTQLQAVVGELDVRREAIRAAKLSLEANEQSFKGGFRTRVDVLNAIRAQFQAEADSVTALLRFGEVLLGIQLAGAVEVDLALRQVQQQVFAP